MPLTGMTKRFGNERYKYHGWRNNKTKAQAAANGLRRKGYLARISKAPSGEIGYTIWYRSIP